MECWPGLLAKPVGRYLFRAVVAVAHARVRACTTVGSGIEEASYLNQAVHGVLKDTQSQPNKMLAPA